MQQKFSVLFYPKGNDIDREGRVPIYMRITVNGKRSELSIQRKIEPENWNSDAGKARGTNSQTKNLNFFMDKVKGRIFECHQELIDSKKEITSDRLKSTYLGIDEERIVLGTLFNNHNDQVKKLVGKEFVMDTYRRYETTLKYIKDFLKFKYNLDDIDIKEINHQFITNLDFYLKSTKNCGHNTAAKYIKNFKKIIKIALANNWIDKDPFINYKIRIKEVERDFLSKEEVQEIINKDLYTARLDQVRDVFIFCCYTGLAYVDVKKITRNNLVKGIDGEMWIKTNRTKTDTRSNIPLLPSALRIIEKYKDHKDVVDKDILLPVLSNQNSNAYLKEIADLCGITKNLTTHLARHTFATTITLSNGVPIESVSKMLGHKSLKTTQHYAKIIDRKVSDDMLLLKEKMALQTKENVKKAN